MAHDILLQEPLHGDDVLRGQHRGQLMDAERVPVGHELPCHDVGQVKDMGPAIKSRPDFTF